MVFATAARHDQALAHRQSAIEGAGYKAFEALADREETKGDRRVLLLIFALTGAMTLNPAVDSRRGGNLRPDLQP